MALKNCKECGEKVSTKAKTCPKCGAKAPKKTSFLTWAVLVLIVFVVIGVMRQEASLTPEERAERAERLEEQRRAREERAAEELAARQAEEAENKRKGFHCLSSWNGMHRGVERVVKENLRDPSSFEHIETRITPVNQDGKHRLMMSYRAANAFGGKTVGNAIAIVDNSSCEATVTSIE